MFCKPEPGFAELEKKLKSFSQKSAVLKEVLLEFKGELEAPPVGVHGDLNSSFLFPQRTFGLSWRTIQVRVVGFLEGVDLCFSTCKRKVSASWR